MSDTCLSFNRPIPHFVDIERNVRIDLIDLNHMGLFDIVSATHTVYSVNSSDECLCVCVDVSVCVCV